MSKLLTGLKHYGDVTVTQRTATGNDGSERTTLYIVKGILFADDVDVTTEDEAIEKARYNSSEILGTVTAIHSHLLAGSWGENLNRFIRIAREKLVDDGVFEDNNRGTYRMI